MHPHPCFTTLPQDDARSSHEMLHIPRDYNNPINDDLQTPQHTKSHLQAKNASFPWRTILTIALLPLTLAPIITLSSAARLASTSYIRGRSCYPNGLWKFAPGASWEIMDSSYFFTPNLSFGAMTFTQVKVIDVAWDLVVGRGGQVGLAWVNYRVFNAWIVGYMERHGVGWKVFGVLAFETTTVQALGVLGKEALAAARGQGIGWVKWSIRWLAVVSMFLSTLYVLSFPTLVAAMTGYIAKSEAYVADGEGNLVAWAKVDTVRFVVEDGDRVPKRFGKYDGPLVVGMGDTSMLEAIYTYLESINLAEQITNDTDPITWNSTYQPKPLPIRKTSSFFTLTDTDGFKIESPISSPTLNITLYPVDPNEGVTSTVPQTFSVAGRQSSLYNSTHMLSQSSCKPGETYQWGFSYIFLFMVSIFNFIWSCIMVGMWLDTRRRSRVYKSGRRPGLLRSVVEYAAAIREEIGEQAGDLEEEELRQRLRGSRGRLVVPKEEVKVRRVEVNEGELVERKGWKRSLTRGSTF